MLNEKGVELLKQVIQEKYKNIRLDNAYADENEFYYEFKIDEQVSENDFDSLENEIRKLEKDILKLKKAYPNDSNVSKEELYIFGGIKPLSPSTINRYKAKACKRADIRPITLHQFRHSHATFLIQKGIMINEVSKRLGHSKVSTTLDVYSHTDLSQEKRVIDTLNSTRLNLVTTLKYKLDFLLKRLISH